MSEEAKIPFEQLGLGVDAVGNRIASAAMEATGKPIGLIIVLADMEEGKVISTTNLPAQEHLNMLSWIIQQHNLGAVVVEEPGSTVQ